MAQENDSSLCYSMVIHHAHFISNRIHRHRDLSLLLIILQPRLLVVLVLLPPCIRDRATHNLTCFDKRGKQIVFCMDRL